MERKSKKVKLPIFASTHKHEAIAADIACPRQRDGQRKAHGNCRIHSIAPLAD